MTAQTSSLQTATLSQAQLDEGLRAHMLQVYNYLAGGLAVAAIVAWTLFKLTTTGDPSHAAVTMRNGLMLTEFGRALYASPWMIALCLAPIGIIIIMAIAQAMLGVVAAQIGYWLFVATVGASTSVILLVYTIPSIMQILAITSASFAALSLWGYTTKRDISGWGTFLYMGLAGLIFAGLLNLILRSEAVTFAQSVAGVLIFAAFTAFDTQQLKDRYVEIAGDATALSSAAVWGAMNLFLDFVNMLLYLLRLFGQSR